MLILIGTVPPPTPSTTPSVLARSRTSPLSPSRRTGLQSLRLAQRVIGDARTNLTDYIRTKQFDQNTMLAARQMVEEIDNEVVLYKSLNGVPANQQTNVRTTCTSSAKRCA